MSQPEEDKEFVPDALEWFKTAGQIKPQGPEKVLRWNGRVAPSFGPNLGDTIYQIEEHTKVAIVGATKAVMKIKESERDWAKIVHIFNNSPMLRQWGEKHEKRSIYTNHGWNWFKFDAGPNKAIVQEVQAWFEILVDDSDVLDATRINMDDIRNIVATTGRAISKLDGITAAKDKSYREISIAEFGVLRYPRMNDPYFKLYCIKLFAWASYQGSGIFKKSHNGIKGVFMKQTYQPNYDIIGKIDPEVIKQAVTEAETLLTAVTDV